MSDYCRNVGDWSYRRYRNVPMRREEAYILNPHTGESEWRYVTDECADQYGDFLHGLEMSQMVLGILKRRVRKWNGTKR